ncbi:MAG: cupin-like domain-containing protein [Bdellovibrionota bacterium]|nr:cupin-like domain-containing protein [Bdellovibrionota bacterium]
MNIATANYNELTLERFIEDYFKPEKPVLIKKAQFSSELSLDIETVKALFEKEDMKRIGWYDALPKSEITIPLIDNLLKSQEKVVSQRQTSFRVFMQPKGHRTFLHYDGNSIHGFNYQFRGRKRWVIIDPDTPSPYLPFMYVAYNKGIEQAIPKNLRGYQFEMEEGDLLFLPRYWQHQVDSLEEVNINFNWVLTPMAPAKSRLAIREREVVLLRDKIAMVNKAFFPDDIKAYGGRGKEIIDNYTRDISNIAALKRLFIELSAYIRLPFYFRHLKRKSEDFKNNNFKV